MLGVIPYLEFPPLTIGSFSIEIQLVLFSACIIVGLLLGRDWGAARGLAPRDVVDGLLFSVGMGVVGGHVVEVIAYQPERWRTEGWASLAQTTAGRASIGGLAGGIAGTLLFYKVLRKRPWLAHSDAICFAFPFAEAICRLGCFAVHDHVGVRSDFFLAVDFPGGARHDLGLYGALLGAAIGAIFWALRRRSLPEGFFCGLFFLLYAPARFGLDFLRAPPAEGGDVRYDGLTPAQWGTIVLAPFGAALMAYAFRSGRILEHHGSPAPTQ